MPKTSHALTLVADPKFAVAEDGLSKLKEAAIAQVSAISHLESKAALGALIAGLTLHRVKASLPHGQFVKWLESVQKCTSGAHFKRRQAAYYMALALVFLEKAKVQKPDLLALPGDQLSLEVGDGHAAQQFFAKAQKFVGDLSLNELLIKHGIKGVGLQKELAKAAAAEEPTPPPTAEQLYQQSRDEIGHILTRAEDLFIKENRLQYLAGNREEIAGVVASLRRLADKVEAAAKPLLNA